ncbi:hypothetical protein GCM10027037_24130 [Mucilaginibacter koreensis]
MPACCRIYLFTYKRNRLLKRAIDSLLAQTYTNWICELHNDCPDDSFPGQYIASLHDDRFLLKNHPQNLGPTQSFNLAFAGCAENYVSILEDDNWWEPSFLQEMVSLMNNNPDLDVAWSNMRIWKEQPDGKYLDTGCTTWPIENGIRLFNWPQPQQAMGALHSNSALIYRAHKAAEYQAPPSSDSSAIELIRERAFKFPMGLHAQPLANFSDTIHTSRTQVTWIWTLNQVMVLNSFIITAPHPEDSFKSSLAWYRRQSPSPVANFLLAVMLLNVNSHFLKHFNVKDWMVAVKWLLKNGRHLSKMKRYLNEHQTVNQFLMQETSKRYAAS